MKFLMLGGFVAGQLVFTAACSAQNSADAGARDSSPTEACSQVRYEDAEGRTRIAEQIRQLRADDERAAEAGTSELERNQKFMEFQAELEAIERRRASRLAQCSETK